VRQARENGHLVFLCTGRSLAALWPEIVDVGWDGVVAAAGCYVEIEGEVLVHHHLSAPEVRRVKEFLDARGVEYFLESNDGLFGSDGVAGRMRHLLFGSVTDEDVLAELERGLGGFIDSVKVGADPFAVRINKVSFLDSEVTLDEFRAEFADAFDIIPTTVPLFGPNSGEMALKGVHKAGGIDVLISHLGIDRADTLALGDGFNDLEMLAHVGVGIAMGNAPQQVRDVADETTGSPDEHGIRDAFVRHALIGPAPVPRGAPPARAGGLR
jgi:Cof subfamily protein (haloacid dehalogenase superfamily)